MELIEKELTYAIRGCFFAVHNQIGWGMEEEAYHQGLIRAFAEKGLRARSKDPVWISYRGNNAVEFIPDFVVADRVVIEIKALREGFAQEHFVQLFSYLKATRIGLGFLVNFGTGELDDRRFVYTEKPFELEEEWGEVKDTIGAEDREALVKVRESLIDIGSTFGVGYGDVTYRRLMKAAVMTRSLAVDLEPTSEPYWGEVRLGQFETNCMLIDSRVVCAVMALKDGLQTFDIGRVRTYLRHMKLNVGVVANFGKDRLQLMGIRNDQP